MLTRSSARRFAGVIAPFATVPVVVATALLVARAERPPVEDECGLDARALQARFETARA